MSPTQRPPRSQRQVAVRPFTSSRLTLPTDLHESELLNRGVSVGWWEKRRSESLHNQHSNQRILSLPFEAREWVTCLCQIPNSRKEEHAATGRVLFPGQINTNWWTVASHDTFLAFRPHRHQHGPRAHRERVEEEGLVARKHARSGIGVTVTAAPHSLICATQTDRQTDRQTD